MAKSKSSAAVGPHGKDVFVQPRPGGWEVKKQGTQRATAVTATKQGAVAIGRAAAQKEHSELIIKGKDGKIQTKDSHGHESKRAKG